MAEPSRRASRLTIAAAMLAALSVGALGFALGRSTAERAPGVAPTPTALANPPPAPAPVLPATLPPLGRAELITAASSAADAFASGQPLPESVAALAGRAFELRLPFGCPGVPQMGAGALTAGYDEESRALRVRAEPVTWSPEEWLESPGAASESAPAVEGIEGFWISRPWTSAESCPATRLASADAPPPVVEQTLGVAQIFTADTSRVGRRDGKAYEAVKRAEPGALDLSQGFRLRLRGKLARATGGGPVLCRGATLGMRPACLLTVELDEVAVELPSSGAAMATWDVSSQTGNPPEQ